MLKSGQLHIVWGLDGAIFDTAPALARITAELAADRGLALAPEQVFRDCAHLGAREAFSRIASSCGAVFDRKTIAALCEAHESRKEALYAQGAIPLMPGLREALQELADAGHLLGIGANSDTAHARDALAKSGLLHFFGDRVYGGADSGGLLRAMEAGGSTPINTIAITGTEPGMAAGRAAHVYTVGVLDRRFCTDAEIAAKTESFRNAGVYAVIRDFNNLAVRLPIPVTEPLLARTPRVRL